MSNPLTPRQVAIEALRANPLVSFTDEQLTGLGTPDFNVSLEELGMDSLAMMELSIWLEVECGVEATEEDIREMSSLSGIVDFLERKLRVS